MKNLNQIKLYCLDMDGTIYLDDVLIPNVIETLNFLREKARIVFLTNNSSKSKDAYIEKLNKLGIKVTNNEIYTSGMATCEFIKEKFNNKKVYLVGTEALIKEFNDYKIPLDDINPDIVVLSYDTSLNYQKLVKLTNFIHQGKIFIATHPDINCPALPYYVPDIGSFLALIEKSTGKSPDYIIGKPEKIMGDTIKRKFNLNSQQIAMVGDRLSTDIAFANNNNFLSILVLSGESSLEDYNKSNVKADYIFQNINEILNNY